MPTELNQNGFGKASRLLTFANVKEQLEKRYEKKVAKLDISAERVLNELARS